MSSVYDNDDPTTVNTSPLSNTGNYAANNDLSLQSELTARSAAATMDPSQHSQTASSTTTTTTTTGTTTTMNTTNVITLNTTTSTATARTSTTTIPNDDDDNNHHTTKIQMIPKESIERIVAGQAIYDLTSCIKELIDNAIDANSKTINIRLHNKGIAIIEVSDDGTGIPKESRPYIALPHATSKITKYEDIYSNNNQTISNTTITTSSTTLSQQPTAAPTFGFRGEALYCISNLSKQLIVATRTKSDTVAEKMIFHKDGTLNETNITTLSRKIGTTVGVFDLFHNVPVRRKDYIQRIVEQRQKMIQMIIGYAIYHPNIRFHCMDIHMKTGREKSLFITPYYPINQSISLKESISSILGSNIISNLSNISVDLSQYIDDYSTVNNITINASDKHNLSDKESTWKMSGYISLNKQEQQQQQLLLNVKSSATNTTTKAGVHYFAINQRPVDIPKLSRLLNKLYRSYYVDNNDLKKTSPASTCCTCVVEFQLPLCTYDINLSPDKRQVQFYNEPLLFTIIEHALIEFWRNDLIADPNNQASVSIRSIPTIQSLQHKRLSVATITSNNTSSDRKPSLITATSSSNHQMDGGNYDDNASSDSSDSMSLSGVIDVPTDHPLTQRKVRRQSVMRGDALNNSSMHSVDSMNRSFHRRYAFVHDPQQSITKQLEYSNTSSTYNRSNDSSSTVRENFFVDSGEVLTEPENDVNLKMPSRNRLLADSTLHDYYTMKESKPAITPSPEIATNDKSTFTTAIKDVAEDHDHCSSRNAVKATDKEILQFQHMKETFRRSSFDKSDNDPAAIAQSLGTEFEDKERTVIQKVPSLLLARFGYRQRSKSDSDVNLETEDRHQTSLKRQRPTKFAAKEVDDVNVNEIKNVQSTIETAPSTLSSPTLWQSIVQSSDDVVLASMQDRIATIRRKRHRQQLLQQRQNSSSNMSLVETIDSSVPDVGASVTAQTQSATTNQAATLRKADLQNMKVIGQFNLGFILACTPDNNLWILDQHACDERYQFESLLRSKSKFYEQPLIAPLPLELSYVEETCLLDHMSIFEQNGFRLQYDETKPSRHRFSLLAVPHSGAPDGKNAVQYGKQDVIDLCSILLDRNNHNDDDTDTYMYSSSMDGGTGTDGSGKYGNNAVRRYAGSDGPTSSILSMMTQNSGAEATATTAEQIILRLPKTIAMMASRACRSSIMIGKALSKKEMEKLVQRLSSDDIVSPFICAHGRPTICHLLQQDVCATMIQSDERNASEHIAGPTITCLSQEAAADDGEEESNNMEE